jgi:hypothetical protein
MGSINQEGINRLSLVANLIKHIRVNKNSQTEDDSEFAAHFPTFVWLLRDMMLDLCMGDPPIPCSAKEYLEAALALKSGHSDAVKRHNDIRHQIRDWFPNRDLWTLCRPIEDEAKLKKIDTLPFESLRPEFQSQSRQFVKFIMENVQPKRSGINGNDVVTGVAYAGMVEQYVHSFNTRTLPSIMGKVLAGDHLPDVHS